ncbi:hypothetical protein V5O48_009712 [Marasmius crinis-equi]|uniref:JmjC domain-containing protein n=1 Tax=Marasmius crinis-equi TaxID=585013 RepID=A0ABR3FAD2_9AGAR
MLEPTSSAVPPPPEDTTFLLKVWHVFKALARTSEYFFTSEEEAQDEIRRQETWWNRVQPVVRGLVDWPVKRVGSKDEWGRLKFSRYEDLAAAVKNMNRAASVYKAGIDMKKRRRAGITPTSTRKRKKSKLSDDPPPLPGSYLSGGSESCLVEGGSDTGDGCGTGNGVLHMSRNVDGVQSAQPVYGAGTFPTQLASGSSTPPDLPDKDAPRANPTLSPPVYNLVPSVNRQHREPIIWKSNDGAEVRTAFPFCPLPSDPSKNVLWKAAEVLFNLADIGLTEKTTDHLLVVDKSQHPEEQSLVNLATECLAANRPLLVKGDRVQGGWENGLSDDVLRKLSVEWRRKCHVFDFVQREMDALRGGTDVSPNDAKYELPVDPITGQDRWFLPVGMAASETESMVFSSFLSKAREGRNIYILDCPTSDSSGIPYRSLDHIGDCLNNTKWLADAVVWRDLTWGLVHASQIITWWHHDADGKVTVVTAVTGAKIWTLFIPDPRLSPDEVRDIHIWLAERKERLPLPSFGTLVNVLLMPGDALFMPPGMMHLVYTPVPSIFRGSSFWNFHCLHLTAFSLRCDSTFGDIITNVDHSYEYVYQTIVRLVLAIPVMSDFNPRKALVYSLYDMLINPQRYISVNVSDADYPKQADIDAAEKRLKKSGSSTGDVLGSLLDAIKERRVHALMSAPFHDRAVKILESIITSDGNALPSSTGERRDIGQRWVDEHNQICSWTRAGDLITVDKDVLLKLAEGSSVDDDDDLGALTPLSESDEE